MTSFQRMVLVAAVLFMITAHVTDAVKTLCACFFEERCDGYPNMKGYHDGKVCCEYGFDSYECIPLGGDGRPVCREC
uniref:Uncharacterized protein n=1 Tax=Amphimedon queenslandica TaxID=400682 RepID=A0A1X7SR02_AMPQE